ncbi:MAG: hypothetical protein ACRCZI_07655, partial [Cetobacterium sp.]
TVDAETPVDAETITVDAETPVEAETITVDAETPVDAETITVEAETITVDAETPVDAETITVEAETITVDAETITVEAETITVDAETPVDAETITVDAETPVEAETITVDAETITVDAETITVEAETITVDAETPVEAETINVEAETINVDAETPVEAETITVEVETITVEAETITVEAETIEDIFRSQSYDGNWADAECTPLHKCSSNSYDCYGHKLCQTCLRKVMIDEISELVLHGKDITEALLERVDNFEEFLECLVDLKLSLDLFESRDEILLIEKLYENSSELNMTFEDFKSHGGDLKILEVLKPSYAKAVAQPSKSKSQNKKQPQRSSSPTKKNQSKKRNVSSYMTWQLDFKETMVLKDKSDDICLESDTQDIQVYHNTYNGDLWKYTDYKNNVQCILASDMFLYAYDQNKEMFVKYIHPKSGKLVQYTITNEQL